MKSMRILVLVDCYLPSCKSGAKQMHDLSVELLRYASNVTVLTASHEISSTIDFSMEEGVRVIRVRTPRIKGAGHVARAITEMRLSSLVWGRARRYLLNHPAELIIFYSPSIFWGALVHRLKSLWRCQTYLILRDIFPEWAAEAGVLSRGFVYKFFRRQAIKQYDSADVIAVQSPGDLAYFHANFPEMCHRLETLYNWTRLHETSLPNTEYRRKLGLGNKVVFFCGGNLGIAQDVDNLLRLAASLRHDERIAFLFVGDGSESRRVQKAIVELGLSNGRYLPAVAQQEYLAMVSEFDVGLISLDRRLTNHNIPGKMLSYFYSGIPVLASVNPKNDLFGLLEENQAGRCAPNGDDARFRMAALELTENRDLRVQLGRNGRALLERDFTVETAAKQIVARVRAMPHVRDQTPSVELLERAYSASD